MGPKEASKGDDAAALPGRNQMMPLLRHRSLPLLIVILNNFAFKKPQYSPLEDSSGYRAGLACNSSYTYLKIVFVLVVAEKHM